MDSDGDATNLARVRSLAIGSLIALTGLRLAVAGGMPLSPDEAYYWVWSKALAPGYLDHPPMVALWIRLGTAVLGDGALGVRLLGPLAGALGSVLLADAGRVLFGLRAGLRAAVLLNATLIMGAGTVTMTPDTPLLLFWTAAAWALARVAAGTCAGGAGACAGGAGAWWLVVGGAAGLALDSKYSAGLLGVGIGAWLLTPGMRHWLRTPWPWAGGLVAAAAFLPVVLWNAGHGWASFIKQGGRAADWAPSRAVRFLAELLAGQAGLATPLLFALFVAGTVTAARRWRDVRWGLVTALVVPGVVVLVQHALGDRVQANWAGIVYPGAALAAGAAAGAGAGVRWWRAAAWLGAALTAVVYVQATLAPLPLPRGLDPTLRMAGWDGLARAAADEAGRQGAAFVASEEYGAASLLAWSGPGVPARAAEARWALTGLPRATGAEAGLLLITTRRHEDPDPALWSSWTPLPTTLTRSRGGVLVETYRLYRVTQRPGAPVVSLPQRMTHGPERPR